MAWSARVSLAGGRLRGGAYRPWRRGRALRADQASESLSSKRSDDPDARDQRQYPAENSGLSIIPRYRSSVLRGGQGLDRMQYEKHADRPVRNPSRIIEHHQKHDQIGRAYDDQGGDDDTSMEILSQRPDQTGKIFPQRGVQPDQQREHRDAQNIGGHARPGIGDFPGERLIPDVTEAQELGPGRVGHAPLQIPDELRLRHRHRSQELRGEE